MNMEDTPGRYLPRRRAATLLFSLSLLLQSDCYHAFCPRPPRLIFRHHNSQHIERGIKLHQTGPGSDYLSNLSVNNEEDNSEKEAIDELAASSERKSKNYVQSALSSVSNEVDKRTSGITSGFASVSSEVGKRTSGITSGFTNVTKRGSSGIQSMTNSAISGVGKVTKKGGSDIQSLTNSAISGVGKVTKKGTRDIKRTTLGAQKLVKKGTDGLMATGKGLTDMHFFEFESPVKSFSPIVKFSPKIQAEEIAKWIDSQAKSGTEIVGSKSKKLVLNFTGKREYQFGDVTKEVIHRVKSQDVNMQDVILLLKVSHQPSCNLLPTVALFIVPNSRNLKLLYSPCRSVLYLDSPCTWSYNWTCGRVTAFYLSDRGIEYITGTKSGR